MLIFWLEVVLCFGAYFGLHFGLTVTRACATSAGRGLHKGLFILNL